MVNLSCENCGAAIIPDTNFCRSCGAAVESQPEPSEMQTALLDERVLRPNTQRLEPRTTTETREAADVGAYRPASPAISAVQAPPAPRASRRWAIIVVVLVVMILLGGGGLLALKRARQGANKVLVNQRYTYPGAQTVLNIGDGGGGVLQMETTDRIDKVSEWYLSTFKPTKTIWVTPSTTIIKDETVTVTLAASDNGTSIVIKQVAQ